MPTIAWKGVNIKGLQKMPLNLRAFFQVWRYRIFID